MDSHAARLFPRAQMPTDTLPVLVTKHNPQLLLDLVRLPWRVFDENDWNGYSGCEADCPLTCEAMVDGLPATCILDASGNGHGAGSLTVYWYYEATNGMECRVYDLQRNRVLDCDY